jgi:hypothetical protein
MLCSWKQGESYTCSSRVRRLNPVLSLSEGRSSCLTQSIRLKGSVNRTKKSCPSFALLTRHFLQVLGFEETPSKRVSVTGHSQPFSTFSQPHSRTQSQPLPSEHPRPRAAPPIIRRARAPSDPFLDTPALSHSIPTSSSQSSGNTIALLSSTLEGDEPPSPISLAPDGDNYIGSSARSSRNKSFEDDAEEAALRTWTSPNLSNPELHTLLSVFPAFVTRRTLPRFPVPARRQQDVEEIEEERGEGKEIQFGTGTMWVSSKLRTDGWSGSWWSRFVMWWRQTFFCC